MSDIFPKWTNRLPVKILIGALLLLGLVIVGLWYYFTPSYTRVGYTPTQPVAYSHKIHVDQLGLDCRYCHDDVDESAHANIPAASTCMNCHEQVLPNSPKLEKVRASAQKGEPIPWVKVHKMPEFVFFNHAAHVNRGVSCVECHGQVNKMEKVRHAKPLNMSFCLDCHRHPETRLRRPDQVYNLDLQIPQDKQKKQGKQFVKKWNIDASQNCSACHR